MTDQWQPIQTAPKNGSALLVWIPELHRPVVAWNWADEWDGDAVGKPTPTHWMPLPDAPKETL